MSPRNGFAQMASSGRSDSPDVAIASDARALVEAAAQRIAALCERATRARGRFTWALAGGSTPRELYARLAGPRFRAGIDWARVEFFWGDERCVPPDHPESNYRMVRETLLDAVQPDPARVHRMQGEAEPAAAAAAYAQTLHRCFALHEGAPPPRFDLVLLGLGTDGHTASLFPGSAALDERQRWVVAVDPRSEGGPARLTLTLPVLNAADQVMFLVSGRAKAARVRQVLERAPGGAALPAQRVRPDSGQLQWMIDADAASLLARSG